MSQPSVSRQLKLLEEEYGVKFFKKVGRGIELTGEGRIFLSKAQPLLLQADKLKEKFPADLTSNKAGPLTVGGSLSPSMRYLPTVLAVFRETHPKVQLTLRTSTSRTIERLVLDSKVEIGVITSPSGSSSLIYEPYRKEKLAVFDSVKHPLARRQALTLEELAQMPLVVKRAMTGEVGITEEFLKQLEKKGFTPNIAMESDSAQAVKAAVKAGIGLGILYRDIVDPDIRAGDLKVIKIPELKMQLRSFIIYHKARSLSANAQDFLTLLKKWPQRQHGLRISVRAA